MTLDTFTKNLTDLLRSKEYRVRAYSGRGMGDRSCVAVTLGYPSDAVALGILIGQHLDELDPAKEHRGRLGASMDGMGQGIVIYFRGLPWTGGDEEG